MAYTTIDDPSAHFQTAIYTGDGNDNRALTNNGNSNLKPDMLWIKTRNQAYNHSLWDSSRGVTLNIRPNHTNADITDNAGIKSYNTDGFTVGTSAYSNESSSVTYVAWQWKANGGTTASNTSGNINSVVQANTDAGFSIVTYTGNGSASTIGHSLGVVPAMIIVKNREVSANWTVYHKNSNATPQNYILELNNTNAAADNDRFNDTAPTSSVFSVNAGSATVNQNTNTYIAYCFAEKQGYSKFGKYVGNANANGTFVYTGFKPAFVMVKGITSNGYHWRMHDSSRNPHNEVKERVTANSGDAAYSGTSGNDYMDFLSNGFKLRSTRSDMNVANITYIYMAFAENPFTTSTGIPTTAR